MNARRTDDRERPLYMISVAAELSGMHPQTLRIYERRALIKPQRSGGNTRLYSDADIERLRLIQHLTQIEGINLAGVIRIMELENEVEFLRTEVERMSEAADVAHRRAAAEAERVHQSYRADIVLVRRGGMARREER
ncbi:MAG: MerR family transcriptional regulator [Coriobacteriaceae bacterium]|nr:MerR family transcriptional regulator [Coriobacteriaceae bacterium]